MTFVLASGNAGKLAEMRSLLGDRVTWSPRVNSASMMRKKPA